MNLETLYKKFDGQKQNGFICPLFFLKTEDSSQLGEYPDLKKLALFAKACGFQIIQLLPIFDTGPESSPYSSRSCFALNPIYIALNKLEDIDTKDPDYILLYQKNETPYFNYYETYLLKMKLLKKYVWSKKKWINSRLDFHSYVKNNSWLEPYAIFCVYKEMTDLPPEKWQIDQKAFCEQNEDDIFFHIALQFFCHEQFTNAQSFIKSQGIELMGDIPILLSPDSVEMWTHKELFDFNLTVGAAPDQYSDEGQTWGFPLIRFVDKPMECIQFWKARIHFLSSYFSLYRIDHAVGFFRLWVMPKGEKARYGHFFPNSDEAAINNAKIILGAICKDTPMIPIAEDLGVIPDYVKKFITEAKLCGTKVVRWERQWEIPGQFIPFNEYPHYSMATLSTHDLTFMFEEWSKDIVGAKGLANLLAIPYSPSYSPSMQEIVLKKLHKSGSLFVINMIQEYLYLYPGYQNLLFRVNDPSIVSSNNWTTIMSFPIEKLTSDAHFCQKIHKILKAHV